MCFQIDRVGAMTILRLFQHFRAGSSADARSRLGLSARLPGVSTEMPSSGLLRKFMNQAESEPPEDFGLEVVEMPRMKPQLRAFLDDISSGSMEGFSEETLAEFDQIEREQNAANP